MPLDWDELDDDVRPDRFDVRSAEERVRSLRKNPWAAMSRAKQSISEWARRAAGI